MDSRRRAQREARLKEELEKYRRDNPKITEQFRDLKRKLGDVTYEEWDAIPDIGDYTIKKKKDFAQFAPAPDTLLQRALDEKGVSTQEVDDGALTDLNAVGEGRGTVLGLKLDKLSDSVSGQTVVDPKGYLTDLKSIKISSEAEISDIKKARLLLKSVISTNPKHAPGWIAAARLEELAGKLQAARSFIQKGCDACPKSEDVWIEAARLNTPENAKAILARGVVSLPNSVKIWMQAAKLEAEDDRKRRVLRRALENIPNSVKLWKAVVDLSREDDARVLLSRAVECCPQHVDLWLALARLETYEQARKVLNKARETLPTEPAIWITAAKLEEANGNGAMVGKIVERAVKSLGNHGVSVDREYWLKEAEAAEKNDPPALAVCREIVRVTVGAGVEEEDMKRTWKADAAECEKRGSTHTARAILAHACGVFPAKKGLWVLAAKLEKSVGDSAAMDALLKRAVVHCPRAEVLWLMAAKERWLCGDVPGARDVLEEAFVVNPDSEDIWLAAFKLEFENREPERARVLLAKIREKEGGASERVWMKSAIVEREVGDVAEERRMLAGGLEKFPAAWKMWLMLGQLEEAQGDVDAARTAYTKGCRRCHDAIPLWTAAATLEQRSGFSAKARAILEQARTRNPKNEWLWLAATRQERAADPSGVDPEAIKAADALLSKGLQECPASGALWAEAVKMAPRPQRKAKSVDALKRCDNDPRIIASIANLFWQDRKVDKARSWFNRSCTIDPDIGDHWAAYYRFELQHGGDAAAAAVAKRCREADPKHGELWQRVGKNVKNWHDDAETLLKKCVAEMGAGEA
jgi:pre-mRNA-processing factor 6